MASDAIQSQDGDDLPIDWEDARSQLMRALEQLRSDIVALGAGNTKPQVIYLTAGAGFGLTTGSVTTATIADNAVTNAKLADMAAARIKGRAVGAGTGDPTDLTPDQAQAILDTATTPYLKTGATAGGVLGGTYPNPSFAVDMATQAELDAHLNDTTDAHDASAISFSATGAIASTDVQSAIAELDTEKETAGTALAVIAIHEAAADPHPQYQKESEKGAASGYASLDGSTKVPIAEIPTGSTAATVCIGNDARLSDTRTPTDNTVATAKIQDDAVTYAKMQDVSAASKLLGRGDSGGGDPQEISLGTGLAMSGTTLSATGGAGLTAAQRSALLTNYCTNADAEDDTSGWSTFADGAAYVDGTGGSPSITWTRSTAAPLLGSASFRLSHAASNQQGQGVSFVCDIPVYEQGKALEFRFRSRLASGLYTTNLLAFGFYDVTNGTSALTRSTVSSLAEVTSGGVQQRCRVVVPSSCTQIRISIYIFTTDATACDIDIDDVWFTPHCGPNVAETQDVTNRSTTSASFVDTAIAVALPHPLRSTASRVQVEFSGQRGHTNTGQVGSFEIRRDTTSITPAGVNAHLETLSGDAGGAYSTPTATVAYKCIDAPGSVSATTYRLYWKTTGGTLYLGRRGSDTTIDSPTVLIAEEIQDDSFPSASAGGASATMFRLESRYSASLTRVTTTPAALGEYRARRRAASQYYDGAGASDAAPTAAPSSADGFKLYGGEAWGAADPANEPGYYQIYVGLNRREVRLEFYGSTGRSTVVSIQGWNGSTTVFGTHWSYDPAAGIVHVHRIINSSFTSAQYPAVGIGNFTQYSDVYFSVFVSEDTLS